MNVEKNFFFQGVTNVAKATLRNTVGSNSVPIRIFWLGILILLVIAFAFGVWWLAQRCTGYNPTSFEHFADLSSAKSTTDISGGTPVPKTLGEYLQNFILKNANDTKNALMKASNSLDDAMDGLNDAKENICSVLEDIQSNFVSSHLSGVDPALASEPKDIQDKKIASRQARAQKDWERRKKIWTARHHQPLLECFYDVSGATSGDLSGSVDPVSMAISQINSTCDDINDILTDLQDQIQSPDVQAVIQMVLSTDGSINFATPFMNNTAMIVVNNASIIRNMPKPNVVSTVSAGKNTTTTEGFDNMSDAVTTFNNQFKSNYPDVSQKYTTSTSQASSLTADISRFLDTVANLQKRAKDASDMNKKIKKTQQDIKDGKITPAFMDDKPK